MFFGPVDVDNEVINDLIKDLNEESVVLELGSGVGAYSIPIRRKTMRYLCVEPDARLIRCMSVNATLADTECVVCNAWPTERKIIFVNGCLTEIEGESREEDEIRLIRFEELRSTFPDELTHIVVHSKNFFDTFEADYPEVVKSCTVLKSYVC
jgi:hypothetical protein